METSVMPGAAHTLLQSNLISVVVEKSLNLPRYPLSPCYCKTHFPRCQQILRHLSRKCEQQQLLHVRSMKKPMFHHIKPYLNYLHGFSREKEGKNTMLSTEQCHVFGVGKPPDYFCHFTSMTAIPWQLREYRLTNKPYSQNTADTCGFSHWFCKCVCSCSASFPSIRNQQGP